jgi:hypothetical protein
MKKLLTLILIFVPFAVQAQTIIPEATPVPGQYPIPVSLVDVADFVTPETGITVTGSECQVSHPDDPDWDNCTGTWTEVGNGAYFYTPATVDLDVPGLFMLKINDAAAKQSINTAQILPTADGVAQSATGTTLVLAAASAYANDELTGNSSLYIVSASTGAGQVRCITDYVGSTDTATVDTWTTTPTGTIRYTILNTPNCNTSAIVEANLNLSRSELSAIPDSTPSILEMLTFTYQYNFFAKDATNILETLYKADGTTPLCTIDWTTDGTTTERGICQ